MSKVSFVSSGPGDPELLTLKALKRIEEADVILYDDLSSGDILKFARDDADLIGVGKRAGRPSPKQNHVSGLLVKYAQTGAKTVRLKSGDAGLFGRLEEEIQALREVDIDYEVIAGVPSPMAAAAAFGIPLTRRLNARRLQFVTGHDVGGELPQDINIEALIDENAVTVVFMGKRTFAKLAQRLIHAGMNPKTPVLIAQSVSKAEENFYTSDLEDAHNELQKIDAHEAAIILYGALAEELLENSK